jgi:hypothetical protein
LTSSLTPSSTWGTGSFELSMFEIGAKTVGWTHRQLGRRDCLAVPAARRCTDGRDQASRARATLRRAAAGRRCEMQSRSRQGGARHSGALDHALPRVLAFMAVSTML